MPGCRRGHTRFSDLSTLLKMELKKRTDITKAKAAENRREFEKELRSKAWRRVSESRIPDMVKLGMLMANALATLTEHIDMDIRGELRAMGLGCAPSNSEGDIIRGLRNYSEKTKAAEYWFERDLKPYIEGCTFGSFGVKAYDDFNHSSAEVIQLLMLCVDRGEVDGGMEKVFRSLQRLKKGTRFSDEDIARFDFKE